jgi:serine/threonine protein kinase/Tol biopolymer transport system component
LPLAAGSRFGVYDVIALLGAGGMGQVFRARDTRLGRDVALKILPERVAVDHDRLARFDLEARVLASLNHPNVAHLYGVEEIDGTRALAMELVEGATLDALIAPAGLRIDRAIAIARQIAEALEAAHERGVIHRDLKPANVKVRDDGVVKVLDFGLAKAFGAEASNAAAGERDIANSPTVTSPTTEAGMILGTAAYMSPEQARGRPVDKRADIWAFGAVLYEMLAGRRVVEGDNVSEMIAQVLTKDPDWTALPPHTPPALRDLIGRCLVKDPRNRLRDIGDARLALDALHGAPAAAATPAVSSRRRELALAALVLILAATTISVLVRQHLSSAPPRPAVRFDVLPSTINSASAVRWIDLSPDGRHLAFSTTVPSRGIFVRSIDATAVRLLAGDEIATGPPPIFFWSPDSRFVAYFAEGKLKKAPVDGGPAQVICALPPAINYTGTWSQSGVILFGAATREGTTLWRVSASGGQPVQLPGVAAADAPPQAFFPSFLPDGRRYLAMRPAASDRGAEVFVGTLDSTERVPLALSSPPRYASAGFLLFVRDGHLLAQRFDVRHLTLSGEPLVIVEDLYDAVGQFSTSLTGDIAYRAAGRFQDAPLVTFDRGGDEVRRATLRGSLQAPSLSRDGTRVAIERSDPTGTDIWLIDLVRGTNTRLTDDTASEIRPVLSPDGSRVAFARRNVIYLKSASGTGPEERVVDGEVTDWSPDGRLISFIKDTDLWVVPVDEDRTPTRIVQTNGNDRRGRFSPDGKWIAYESDFSGRFEVYVQAFPPTTDRVQVSASGGGSAYWRRDGRELFFLGQGQTIMTVTVTPGATFRAGPPTRLFDVPGVINNSRFVVTPDGRQILAPIQPAEALPITVVLNWTADGK